jgi:hypothetical protein
MAICDALQSRRFFVQGKHVDIFTDHRTLEHTLKERTLSSSRFNTVMDLNHVGYGIRYIPGAQNGVGDRLSRRANHNCSQAALPVTEITDAGHVGEAHVLEDDVQEDHMQEDHVQEDQVQEDHVRDDHVREDHVLEDHVQQDQVQEDHVREYHVREDQVTEDHVQDDHVREDHVQQDHVQEDHVQEDHVQEDHVQEDHVQQDQVIQGEAVKWLGEVWLAYRTDPFTAVIANLINAGANTEAAARALPASVQRELSAKHSEQRIQHARRQLHRFKFNVDRVLQSGGRLVLPEGRRLQPLFFFQISQFKDGRTLGQVKTYSQLSRRLYWLDVEASVRCCIRGCDLCLRTKARQHAPFRLLNALDIPQEQWKQVGIDFITKLLTTLSGKDAIVTIIDHLTKRAHFIPTTEANLPAEDFASLFFKDSVRLHDMTTKIVSNSNPRFVSTLWRQLIQLLGTKLSMSTAYHTQPDGQSEKVNNIVGTWLHAFARESEQVEWDRLLPIAEFAYNSTPQTSTRKTPFGLDLGYHPRWPMDLIIQTVIEIS